MLMTGVLMPLTLVVVVSTVGIVAMAGDRTPFRMMVTYRSDMGSASTDSDDQHKRGRTSQEPFHIITSHKDRTHDSNRSFSLQDPSNYVQPVKRQEDAQPRQHR